MPSINKKQLPKHLQFEMFDDKKLRLALIGLADKYDEKVRLLIYKTYNDPVLASLYRQIRAKGEFEKGNDRVATRRKILDFPNKYVYDFCKTVMISLYGQDWLNDNRSLNHELIRPWWVVNKLDTDKGRPSWNN